MRADVETRMLPLVASTVAFSPHPRRTQPADFEAANLAGELQRQEKTTVRAVRDGPTPDCFPPWEIFVLFGMNARS